MSQALRALSPSHLIELARTFEARPTGEPVTALQLHRLGCGQDSVPLAAELEGLRETGLSGPAMARLLRLLAEERRAAQAVADRMELVWTGPEIPGAASRDTAVVVRELFASAEKSVLVSTYAIYKGKPVFAPLAARMDARRELRVRLFVNVARPHHDQTTPASQLMREFAESFRLHDWPGARLPDIFYDPRALEVTTAARSALHAKAIIVDDVRAYVTSANFTEAAHERNIEAGVLVHSPAFAASLTRQFESLVEAGVLRRIPMG